MTSENSRLIVLLAFIVSLTIVITEIKSYQEYYSVPIHDNQFFKKPSDSLRRRFLNNKIENQKVRILDQFPDDTIYVDGIPHHEIGKSDLQMDRNNKIETGFKSLLGMKGVKYTFKRGFNWRTWREIDKDGNKTMICYRCNGAVNKTCKDCFNSGYWVIEEKPPPCPYEIVSMPNDNQLCTIHFTQYTNIPSSCPTLINVNDLLLVCDNPIETEWKIARKYNDDHSSESTLSVMCNGRASCHILTLYTVLRDSVLFKIINSTNHIIYSRVMKSGHKNYACVEDCGILDKKTKTVIQNDKPLILNLLDSDTISHKDKREYKTDNITVSTNPRGYDKIIKSVEFFSKDTKPYNKIRKIVWKITRTTNWSTPNPIVNKSKSFTKTLCRKLIEAYTEDYSESVEF